MPSGSCFCGTVKISHTGDVPLQVLCHCTVCQKMTSSAFSINAMVSATEFSLDAGDPKRKIISSVPGREVAYYFCGECGTTSWSEDGSKPEVRFVKYGCMDDSAAKNAGKPKYEICTSTKSSWVPQVEGAKQYEDIAGSREESSGEAFG